MSDDKSNAAKVAAVTMKTATPKRDDPALRVAVGSGNPSKLKAVENALKRALGPAKVRLDLQGFDVASGVDHQPFGDAETKAGAKNRARAAYVAYRKKERLAPHLAVGLEGGLEWHSLPPSNGNGKKNQHLFCMAYMAIYGKRTGFVIDLFAAPDTKTYTGDKKPVYGVSKTASFAMPPAIKKLIVDEGLELGDADDRFFKRVKSKHGSGTVGILTNGVIDRAEYYEHALLLALTPWIRADCFPDGIP